MVSVSFQDSCTTKFSREVESGLYPDTSTAVLLLVQYNTTLSTRNKSTAVYSCFEAVACVYTCSAEFSTKFSTQVLLKFNLCFYILICVVSAVFRLRPY